MFSITKDRTPILFQQSLEVQQSATHFNTAYTGQKSVALRSAWGKDLEASYQGLSETTVNAKGETLSRNKAWIVVCGELGIPRSTADLYRNEYISSLTYPPAIREAAAEAGLNLALDYVQAFYVSLNVKESDLSNENAVRGIIARLEDAPNPNKKPPTKKTVEERLTTLFEDLFEFTADNKVDSGLISFCMQQAAKSLPVKALETWQAFVHQQAQIEKNVHQHQQTV